MKKLIVIISILAMAGCHAATMDAAVHVGAQAIEVVLASFLSKMHGGKMARPIADTPKLTKQATQKFIERVEKGLKQPVGPIATPKLHNAIKLIKADARNQQK